GFSNVKVYDSSWLGYGNTLDAPAENVTFFNVGLLNSRISALQNRIDQLEKELGEAKARKYDKVFDREEKGRISVAFPSARWPNVPRCISPLRPNKEQAGQQYRRVLH